MVQSLHHDRAVVDIRLVERLDPGVVHLAADAG
jgi:hypothetical protein